MFLVGFSLGPLLVFKFSHLDLCDMREVVATLRASYPAMFWKQAKPLEGFVPVVAVPTLNSLAQKMIDRVKV